MFNKKNYVEEICKGEGHPTTCLSRQRGGGRRHSPNPFATSAPEGGGLSELFSGRLTAGKEPEPILKEAGCASAPVWTGTECHAGIRSPDRPSRN